MSLAGRRVHGDGDARIYPYKVANPEPFSFSPRINGLVLKGQARTRTSRRQRSGCRRTHHHFASVQRPYADAPRRRGLDADDRRQLSHSPLPSHIGLRRRVYHEKPAELPAESAEAYLPDDIELPEGPEESPRSRRKARTSESGIPQKDSSSRPPMRSMSAAKRQAFWPPPLA